MGLKFLYETPADPGQHASYVDIVAVHGLGEGQEETWTGPLTGKIWLRDLLPPFVPARRVFTFGYTTDASALLGSDTSNNILKYAHTLVAELEAIRSASRTNERPLMFVCHGLGGILVKKALAFCATQISKKMEHRLSIYISTYAILFLGTPHLGMEFGVWEWLTQGRGKARFSPSDMRSAVAKHEETLESITDQFAPIIKQFRIFFFWEGFQSDLGSTKSYVVKSDSAAPLWADTERCVIEATHSLMCKFDSDESAGFQIISATLARYAREAQSSITARWRYSKKTIETQRAIEAAELVGFDVHHDNEPFTYLNSPKEMRADKVKNEHYYVPHNVSRNFTGGNVANHTLRQKLFGPADPNTVSRQKIFVLYGMGGSGKTQFCLKFCQDNRDRFWGIFWIDASTSENAERALSQIGQLGGLGETHQAGMYWLTGLTTPWLLIVDNADDPKIDYSKFFPAGESGHILVTSRLQACKIHATVGSHEFREMEEEDAITLLLKAANYDDHAAEEARELARPIVRTLGHLPLALTQAGASIQQRICSLEEYLGIYSAHRIEMMKYQSVQSTDQYKYTIYTTWEVSVQRIENTATGLANDAIQLLQILAFLHFEQVPESIFWRAWKNIQDLRGVRLPRRVSSGLLEPSGTTWMESISAFGRFCMSLFASMRSSNRQRQLPDLLLSENDEWDLLRFRQATGLLIAHSLVYKDSRNDAFSMHSMVHFWARERLDKDDQCVWSNIAMNIVAASITQISLTSEQQYRKSLIPHIDACLQYRRSRRSLKVTQHPSSLSDKIKFAAVYSEGGLWKKATDLQKHVMKIRIQTLGEAHPDTLEAMSALARSYWNLSRPGEALVLQRKVRDISSITLGPRDVRTWKATDDLAATLWLWGETGEAQRLSELATDGLKGILGGKHPDTLTAQLHLARNYMHRGHPSDSKKILEKVVEEREKLFGLSHPDTLEALAQLGITYHALRDFDRAHELLEIVVRERCRVLGQEHAYTLWAINDLSKISTDQGHPKEAEVLLLNILDTVTRTLGPEHIGMQMTQSNLARAYSGQEEWTKARDTLVRLISIQERNLPPGHPDRLIAVSELARVRRHLGEVEAAEEMLLGVVEAMGGKFGEGHPLTRKAVGQLAAIYIDAGRLEEAGRLDVRLRAGNGGGGDGG